MPYKIPASVRKEIIEKLLTSPERKKLYNLSKDLIEDILTEGKGPEKAWIFGSFAGKKKVPSDIDLITQYRTPKSAERGYQKLQDILSKKYEVAGESYEDLIDVIPTFRGERLISRNVERFGKKEFPYKRILGLTGALGGATAMAPSREAQASPIGKMVGAGAKAARTAIKEVPSRTSSLLKGTEFMGQPIKKVTKAHGNWRHIILEDGTVYPVTKDVASDLVRHQGTTRKMTEFELKKSPIATRMRSVNPLQPPESQVDQAFKSLEYHESRSNPYIPKKTIRENYKAYLGQVKEAGLSDAVPYSLVKRGNRTFTMPSAYADLLEKEGHLQVVERLK